MLIWKPLIKIPILLKRGRGNEICAVGQEYREPSHATVIPIRRNTDFKPAKVRLHKGDIELLLGIGVVGELRLTVNFNHPNFQIGQGEWEAMARNGKTRRVSSISPTVRGDTKLEEYFPEMGSREIAVIP